jgi:DNA-binding GntR family transcriptional regulator
VQTHRERYAEHAKPHLHVLDLIERERNDEASAAMREHLLHTLDALSRIREILEP